jgi:hypothetical protein
MSRGKHLSLEEARQKQQIGRFCKEHPSQGDEKKFDDLLERMARTKVPPQSDDSR